MIPVLNPSYNTLRNNDSAMNTVDVQKLFKGYGSGSKYVEVLQGLSMKVPVGSIYGLLGPSGCGKTTLLRCIIGRLPIDKGNISTLGKKPGTLGHAVPGHLVGYMPQELALYENFTVGETMRYFGRLHRMQASKVKERTEFLLEFLHLPGEGNLIGQLSGGQKRRVSFAIALLHEPDLLILDEPTVGVDPLLREKIWEHLVTIARTSSTTIIITTHYVEEARQAHMVGLMRNGRLLAEAPPSQLLEKHNLTSLEDVFLRLCQMNDEQDPPADLESIEHQVASDEHQALTEVDFAGLNNHSPSNHADANQLPHQEKHSVGAWLKHSFPKPLNTFALILKNFTNYKRNIGFLTFQFMLPSIQMILFCLCIGGEPYDLDIGITNSDKTTFPVGPYVHQSAADLYTQHLDNRTFVQHHFAPNVSCIDSVRAGKNWACLEMGPNFTTDLMVRFISPKKLDNATIDGSTVHVYLDTTSMMIFTVMQTKILQAYQSFQQDLLTSYQPFTHIDPRAAQLPIKFEKPIYGSLDPSFTNFMAAGIILSITFFMATGLTAMSFVIDKKEGLLDRSLVSGVGYIEIMIAHICTQFFIMVVQVTLLLIFALVVFKVTNEGPLVLVILMTLMQGFVGMGLGMIISATCDNENSAIQACMASMYPSMLLSGIIWPIEAMPHWLQYISVCLPMTLPAQSVRNIMGRGWGLTHEDVWLGFVTTIIWGWGLLIISGIIMKIRAS